MPPRTDRAAQAGASGEAEPAATAAMDEATPGRWPEARLRLFQMVFGTGFVEPGGTQAVLESIGALGLDGTTNFLDIGASLCGSARAITTSFGAYVTAMDLDADLVAAGLSQIRDVHLDKKVDVSILDLEHSGFRENRNAGTMIRNTLTYYYDKLALIDACAVSIKPGGQLLIEDRFLSYQSDTAPFEQWHAGEGVEIFPTDLEKLGRDLVELGLAVRSTNDITMAYMSSLLGAWGDFTTHIEQHGISPDLAGKVMEEAERWARRLTVLRSGDLCIQRIIARKP